MDLSAGIGGRRKASCRPVAGLFLLSLALSPALSFGGEAGAAGPGSPAGLKLVGIERGWDFSLPEHSRPGPYAGLFPMGGRPDRPELVHEGYTLYWADLNPKRGEYDFARVRSILDAAAEARRGVVFRLKSGIVSRKTIWKGAARGPFVPRWVLERHNPTTVEMASNPGGDWSMLVAAPWHEGFQSEYLRFVRAFGEAGLPRHPALYGLYLHGISSSPGEEFWWAPPVYERLAAAGMTPEKLERAFTERLRAWAEAFGPHMGKLAWVGTGWMPAPPGVKEKLLAVRRRLDELAMQLGMGRRGGLIEAYNKVGAAQKVEGGYLVTDEAHPFVAERRYYGDENEEYSKGTPNAVYAYRSAMLCALQMRMRFLWTSSYAAGLDPALSRYFNMTAGKGPKTSPDAWCWLREAHMRGGTLRNFEKWLLQREAEGFRTRPARFEERKKWHYDEDEHGEWAARSTDSARAQKAIGLFVDRVFMDERGAADVTLKVTFEDSGARWRLRYSNAHGTSVTPPVGGTGDGEVRTATFLLPGFSPRSAIVGRFDLALEAEEGDLVAIFVRLIR